MATKKMNEKIYRFALYGATSSGKTILLAALADHRPIFISDYACNAIALGTAPARMRGKQATRYYALKEGKTWLDNSRDALRNGNLPPATETDHSDMLFEYEFGDGQRIYRIELTDYSGEWLDSTVSSKARAIRLRKQLKDKDALLVLAPAPPSTDGDCEFDVDAQRLSSLRESFSLLQSERDEDALRMPIAMLVTKWDRFTPLGDGNLEVANRALQTFLDQQPPPPHRGLFMALRGAVGDPDKNFRAFPVSALGQCRDDGRPVRYSPLYSFNLEEPFIWAARRHDEIELAAYRNKIESYRFDKGWKHWVPQPFSLIGLSHRGRTAIKKLPEVDPLYVEFKREHSTVKKALAKRSASFMAILMLASFFGELIWDKQNYQTVMQTITDPKAEIEAVTQAENWLKAYTALAFPPHFAAKLFLLKTEEAETILTDLRNGRDEVYWAEAEAASTDEKQEKLEQYLAAFPNGRHKIEAIALTAKIVDQLSWEEFLRYYNSNLQEGETVQASSYLQGRVDDPRAKDLVSSFETKALQVLETKIMDALRSDNIEKASEYYAQIQQWPIPFRSATGYEQEGKLKNAIDLSKDRELYEKARDERNDDTLNTYLTTAPIGSMRDAVQANLAWRNAQTGPLKLELSVASIKWDKESGKNGGIQLTIYIKSEKAIQITDLKTQPDKTDNFLLSNNPKHSFTARLDEEVDIEVEFQDTDRWDWFSDDKSKRMGANSKRTKVKNIDGLKITASYKDMQNVVTFKLSGIKQEPPLPAWKPE